VRGEKGRGEERRGQEKLPKKIIKKAKNPPGGSLSRTDRTINVMCP